MHTVYKYSLRICKIYKILNGFSLLKFTKCRNPITCYCHATGFLHSKNTNQCTRTHSKCFLVDCIHFLLKNLLTFSVSMYTVQQGCFQYTLLPIQYLQHHTKTTMIVLVVFAILMCGFISNWYNKRTKVANQINRIPGIKSYPVVGTTHMYFGKKRCEKFDVLRDEATKFPYISRSWIGPLPEVSISKAEYVEKLIGSTKNLEKSFGYKFIRYWLGDGLLISSGEKWHKHRKIITPTFHFKILESFVDIFSEKSKILVDQLNEHCGNGIPFDIYTYITKAALDIICEAAMGVSVRAQEKGKNDYVDAVYEISTLIMERILRPWLHPTFIYNRTKISKKFYDCLKCLHDYSSNVIRLRKATRKENREQQHLDDNGNKKRLAFLDLLLEANENENLLSDIEIREEVDTFMFEGRRSTESERRFLRST